MDVDTSRYMSLRAAEYLRYAKECADAAERTPDPQVRETLRKVVADLTAAALTAVSSGTIAAETGQPKPCCVSTGEHRHRGSIRLVGDFLCQGCITPFCRALLLHSLFDPRREHSSVPTAYYRRRRAQ